MNESPQKGVEAAQDGAGGRLPRDLLSDVFSTFPDDGLDENIRAFSRFLCEFGAGPATQGLHLLPDGRLIDADQPDFATTQTGLFIADRKIAQVFDARYGAALTDTELRLLRGLIAGMSLKEISAVDGVSYQTRRNQLKAVMEKSGATRQAELVATMTALLVLTATRNADEDRNAQSALRRLLDGFYAGNARVYSPHFKDGRSMLVLDLGPAGGRPVVHMHSAFFPVFPFPDDMGLLEALNLRVITPMRPGFFGLPVEWKTPADERIDDFTASLAAFLEDFGLADAPVFSHAHGVVAAVSLCQRLGHRGPQLVVHSGQYTPPEQHRRQPAHIRGQFKLLEKSPRLLLELYRLLARSVARPSKLEQTLERIFGGSPADMAALRAPSVQAWLRKVICRAGRDNIPGIVSDIQTMHADWVSDMLALPTPVTMFYGRHDTYSNLGELTKRFADQPVDLRVKDDQGLISMMFQPREILTCVAGLHPCRAGQPHDFRHEAG